MDELISLQEKTNFFEKQVDEYQKAGVLFAASEQADEQHNAFSLDIDF